MDIPPKTVVRVLARHRKTEGLFPADCLLFQVEHGAGVLRWVWWTPEIPYSEKTPAALLMGERPLAFYHDSGCPTCASMLAAGWGRAPDDPDLRRLADQMNAPYRGLEDALDRLAPVTALLQNGLFVLSYGKAFPTDGEGNFFWDVPPETTWYNATAELYDHVNFRVLFSDACYLYPSQPPDKLDQGRVDYYRAKLQAGETLPPVFAEQVPGGGSMAILLDGHHRAAACALEGWEVPCLTLSVAGRGWQNGEDHIIWPDGTWSSPMPELRGQTPCYGERRSGPMPFQLTARRTWSCPEMYRQAARRFPTSEEAAYLSQYEETELTQEGIRALCRIEDCDETKTAAVLLDYASRQPGVNAKTLAFAFTGAENPPELREAACRILGRIKNDTEIEDFFVHILVYEEENAPLCAIANCYWDV